jgi:general secretion pathway protein D
VIPDQPAKRRDYEENVVRTFYLSNTVQAQDLTEIVTGLRQLLDLKRIFQINGQNAIVIRDSPDKLLVAAKMIDDVDKAKPEVVIQVQVVEARVDRARKLGISPLVFLLYRPARRRPPPIITVGLPPTPTRSLSRT